MGNRGFSLIEIIVATAILISAMVPLWGLLGASHKQVTVSSDEIKISEIAVSILEQIERAKFLPDQTIIKFVPVSDKHITLGSSPKMDLLFSKFPTYLNISGTLHIEDFPTSHPDTGKIIKLVLEFNTKSKVGKKKKSYTLSTFISRS